MAVRLRAARDLWGALPEDADALRGTRLNVLLYLGEERRFAGSILSVASEGFWFFQHGGLPPYEGAPGGFWETMAGEPIVEACLLSATEAANPRRICGAVLVTNASSVARTRASLYWTSTSFPSRALARLRRPEPSPRSLDNAARPGTRLTGTRPPLTSSNLMLARYLPGHMARVSRTTLKKLAGNEQWSLAVSWGNQDAVPLLSKVCTIQPPGDRLWADPHVLHRGDRYHVFFEEALFSRGRGHIAVLSFDESGVIEPARTVLERPYHLSYPFVFEYESELFMIPETSQNSTIELYRCVDFPTGWEFVRNLMTNVRAVDSTVVCYRGLWWLFTFLRHEGAIPHGELFLYSSDDPVGGTWRPHERNPVVSDERRARPAGPFFVHSGELYRPSQQCTPDHRYAVCINQVNVLTRDEYEETTLACLRPEWDHGLAGMHTLTRIDNVSVVDALRWRSRLTKSLN